MDSLCKLCLLLLSEAVLQGNGREMDGKKVMGGTLLQWEGGEGGEAGELF